MNNQYKCSKCGSTNIKYDIDKQNLFCNFCKSDLEMIQIKDEKNVFELKEHSMSQSAQDLIEDNIITLKCKSCGAESSINASERVQIKCYWCRNELSLEEPVSNGVVPDMILPFSVNKEEATTLIENYIMKKHFFITKKFKKDFQKENICGIYMPYMVIDANLFVKKKGFGERIITRNNDNYYNKIYKIETDFNLAVDNLLIECSGKRLFYEREKETNNIINSILPFDMENAIKWNANFLKGFVLEKRDIDYEDLEKIAHKKIEEIANYKCIKIFNPNNEVEFYNEIQITNKNAMNCQWVEEEIKVIGQNIKIIYLPIWLYKYVENKINTKKTHYIAVNGRTKETLGSLPIDKKKIGIIISVVAIVLYVLMLEILSNVFKNFLEFKIIMFSFIYFISLIFFILLTVLIILSIEHNKRWVMIIKKRRILN